MVTIHLSSMSFIFVSSINACLSTRVPPQVLVLGHNLLVVMCTLQIVVMVYSLDGAKVKAKARLKDDTS